MFLDRILRPKQKQETASFNFNQYDELLSDSDRVTLEDMKDEAISQTLTAQQLQEILRISAVLANSAVENGLQASSDDIARFVREFYQSMAVVEQSKNVEIDSEKLQEFVSLVESEDIKALEEIGIGAELSGTLSSEDKGRINLYKQHYVTAVDKAGYNFSKLEVESFIDELAAPKVREDRVAAREPEPTYVVERSGLTDNLPPSRFDDPNQVPKEDWR